MKSSWPKECSVCLRTYDVDQWESLHYRGVMGEPNDLTLELRDCPCGNTISQVMDQEIYEVKGQQK